MTTRKRYVTIPVDPAYFPFVKELKLRYSDYARRDVSWSEFLKWLCDEVFGERETIETADWNIEHYSAMERFEARVLSTIEQEDDPGEVADLGGTSVPGSPLPSNKDIQSGSRVGAKHLAIGGESPAEVTYAEMAQLDAERSLTTELEAHGVIQDDVMAATVARMTLGSVFLSERSCQRIADILLDKVKSQS